MPANNNRDDGKLSFFGHRSLNSLAVLKGELALALKESGQTIEEMVDRLNSRISLEKLHTKGKGGLVSEATVDKWPEPDSLDHVPPLKLMPAICRTLGSLRPLAPWSSRWKEVIVPTD